MRLFSKLIGIMGFVVAATAAGQALAQNALRIGIDAAYRPFAYIDEKGDLAGFEVDLLKAVCAKMQRECNISNVPWDGIFAALDAGTIDMVGTTVTKSAARLEKYDASMTIYRVGYAYLVPADADTSKGLDALKGKSIGTINGTEAYYKFIQGTLGSDTDIRGYDSPDAGVLDLDGGRIAAFMSDTLQLGAQFIRTGKYKFAAPADFDPKWTGEGRGWIFRKGSADMIAPIDKALQALIADGTVKSLGEKYFAVDILAN